MAFRRGAAAGKLPTVQLKKLQLIGFKSFAEKTDIEIGSGMTAVVGPNGSGKSNVVDALLWVLGEQNPRLLRGSNAQDVIFAGTDRLKPLGMAEVRLTVDNTDRTLPIQFAEVTVARRVYRSGESQYLINNSPCRLKDIVDLFLDTGAGRGAYAFVGQNEIDAVLSARPEDRRELFEEAAGIKKYRVRKREALRKLESAEGNLVRIRDILRELEEQREPMERQAVTARHYLTLQERLHEIEVGQLVSELKKADYELRASRQERAQDQAVLLEIDTNLARLERQDEEIGGQIDAVENQLEAARMAQQNARALRDRQETQRALTMARGEAMRTNRMQIAVDLEEIDRRQSQIEETLRTAGVEQEAILADEQMHRNEWAVRKAALAEIEGTLQAALRQVEAQQGERMRLGQERAARESSLRAAVQRRDDAVQRAVRLAAGSEAGAAACKEASTRLEQARRQCEVRAAERARIVDALSRIDARRQKLQSEQQSLRAALEAVRRKLAEQSARLQTLSELQDSHEGFYQGVRAVLNAAHRGQLPGHYAAVVDLLTVPEPLRIAIEVALGGSLQDIVTHTEQEAQSAIQWLKQNRAGRATFLPLPLLRTGSSLSARSLIGLNGALGVAAALVTFAPEYAPVASLLLGRVLVMTDIDAALDASSRLSGWNKIVTVEGETLTTVGALTGGSLQGRGTHLVGRKGEMDDLQAKLPQTQAEVERLNLQYHALNGHLQNLERERSEQAQQEAAAQAALAVSRTDLTAAERDQTRLEREHETQTAAQQTLAAEIAILTRDVEQLQNALKADTADTAGANDAMDALNNEVRSLAEKRDNCRSRTVALEVEVSRLREKREGMARAIAADRAALETLQHEREQKRSRQLDVDREAQEADAEQERLQSACAAAQEGLDAMEADYAYLREERQRLAALRQESLVALKETTRRREEVARNLHAVELRLARQEIQCAQVSERLQEEYSLNPEEALARPETGQADRNTAVEVSRLRREIRAMGSVNTGAIAELERLTERFQFLSAQQGDLARSRQTLLETIAEIDESTREAFLQTFHQVKEEFNRLFQRLFEGGSTDLILSNPDDLLETGIEIVAQPPGKKRQSLSLLSGGERALTATALLFAFLTVRPSPFVLLDEVDAPLDGANVVKFTELVKEFSRNSQFLVITHNPTTMEAAPAWYGVTMREPGVSRILSYRVSETAVSGPPSAPPVSAPPTAAAGQLT